MKGHERDRIQTMNRLSTSREWLHVTRDGRLVADSARLVRTPEFQRQVAAIQGHLKTFSVGGGAISAEDRDKS